MQRLILIFLILSVHYLNGQSIFDNTITDSNPSTANPYTNGQNVAAGITVSGVGRLTGISGAAASNRYNASGWPTANSVSLTDGFSFTLTPSTCINFVSFVYTGQASADGPTNFAFRSSVDGFVANIGSPNETGTTINLSGAAYQNITGPIVFRFYGFNANTGGGTYSINDFTFNGNTSCSPPCTAPTTTVTASQTVCANTATSFTVAHNATSPTFTWQASANGTTGWANVVNATPTGVTYTGDNTFSLGIIGTSAVTYYYRVLVAEGGTCTATSATSTLVIRTTPTINTQPTSVSTTTSSSGVFNVSASGGGLSYQWQQNSGSGFSNITNGGTNPTYAGATTSVLTISNPPLSMSGYSYQCIVANSCGTVTTNGTATLNVTTALQCPQMTGVVINACDGSCVEGRNEVVFFNSGDYSIPVSPANIILKYASTFPPTATYSDGFTTNATHTASLNTLAGCGTLIVDATTAGTIPPNSVFFMTKSTTCFNYDFSAFCGLGTIYVLYSTDGTWSDGGNFANSGTAGDLRYFRTDFTGVGAGCVTDYNYEPFKLTTNGGSSEGAAVSFSAAGAASAYINNGCSPSPAILPIELLDFYATKNGNQNDVIWKVVQEINIVNYIVEKSNDAINFTEMGIVFPNNTVGYKTYSLVDETPFNDITYYRLSTTELEGTIIQHKIVSIDNKDNKWQYSHYQLENNLHINFKNNLPKQSSIHLFDVTGKLITTHKVETSQNTINTAILAKGLYFVQIITPYKTENFKVIVP